MPVMKRNDFESRLVWLWLFRICEVSFSQLLAFELSEESDCLQLYFVLFSSDFTTGWPRASGVGERGDGTAAGDATFPLSFSFRLQLKWKITCTPMWRRQQRDKSTDNRATSDKGVQFGGILRGINVQREVYIIKNTPKFYAKKIFFNYPIKYIHKRYLKINNDLLIYPQINPFD